MYLLGQAFNTESNFCKILLKTGNKIIKTGKQNIYGSRSFTEAAATDIGRATD